MYRIIVRYSKSGLIAYDLKGDTLVAAVTKAIRFKSQGFHVEITDGEGNAVAIPED